MHQIHSPSHHHHHREGRGHPPAALGPSMLRLSLAQRLAIAAVSITVLWAAAFWALRP